MNTSPYHLETLQTIPKAVEDLLYREISHEAFAARGLPPMNPFSIFIKDGKDKVLGGVSGTIFYGSIYIDSLWVDKTLRGQGWGTKLIQEAEKIGSEQGALFATLNTMDWEAFPFYQKLGYFLEFTREGYSKNSKMFLLRKNF